MKLKVLLNCSLDCSKMGPFIIKYLTTKDSFCYFSEKHENTIQHGATIKFNTETTSSLYFSVGAHNSSLKDNEVGISSVYGELFNLEENSIMYLDVIQYMFPIERCCLIPESRNDYEMLEALGDIIQEILLQQLMVVHNDQKCVIWLTNSMKVTSTIGNIQPRSPGLLVHLSAIEVLPPPSKSIEKSNGLKFNFKGREEFFNRKSKNEHLKSVLAKYEQLNTNCDMFRIHSTSDLHLDNNMNDPFTLLVDSQFNQILSSGDTILFKLTVIHLASENSDDSSQNSCDTLAVRVVFVPNLMNRNYLPSSNDKIIFASTAILEHLHVTVGAKCLLEAFQFSDPNINVIHIYTTKFNVPIAVEYFKLFLIERGQSDPPCILIPEVNFEIRKGFMCRLKFIPEASFCIPDADFIRQCKFVAKETSFINKNTIEHNKRRFCDEVVELGQVISDLQNVYDISIKEDSWPLENYLIVGREGSGKTALTAAISSSLNSSLHRPHVEVLSCKRIRGKTPDSLQKILMSSFLKLAYYQPSILILDDLHILCENVNDNDTMSPKSIQSNKSSDLLVDLLDKYTGRNKICIFATTLNTSSLNKVIVSTRGKCYFKNIIQISDLTKENRVTLLRFLMEVAMPIDHNVDLDDLSTKTDGYSVQDLHDFVQKIVFEANKEESINISMEHCSKALSKSLSLSIRTVQLHSAGSRKFSDIGGLDTIKQVMMESIYWPIKHPQIFNRSPLRLQTGILLYGPPGTGKTILAGAIAKQCQLRLIAVNGPELLSKYIGASEQSVRDVFERAQRAKPCILFFDEFDSLVPRRGHDNTGVTDRVVNQFLTQLDGVEELSGVYIVAATSRPDLLDPALLRPGRLDRQLYCELPDKVARISILKTLSKNVTLSDFVDFDEVAAEMEGYSGADIQAVLYSAQLASIGKDFMKEDAVLEVKEISQQHLLNSVKATRPSLSVSEKARYYRIYKQFQGSDQNTAQNITKNQKVTLA